MSTREDCPKCAGVQTLNVMEGLLEMQRYCTACGLDETAPVTAAEPLPWSRPDADPVADLFAAAATARATYYAAANHTSLDTVRKAIADLQFRGRVAAGTADDPARLFVRPEHADTARQLERPGLEVVVSDLIPADQAWVAAPTGPDGLLYRGAAPNPG